MAEKPKLLWHSNAPYSSTGYGQQTGLFTPLLTDHYEVAVSSFYGLNGARLRYGDVTVMPGNEGDFGDGTLPLHAERYFGDPRGGLIVTLMDVWVLDPLVMRNLNLACWVPVDHEPAPPRVRRFFAESGAVPIAMSKFGERMLADFNPLYCPHGVDTETYRPYAKSEARETTHIPQDKFVVGMVAANKGNPSRKAFHEALEAFKVFHERHPDSLLYLHTELTGLIQGVNIPNLMTGVGLDPDAVVFADQYRVLLNPFPAETMAQIYSSLDVLLAASCGEGFGIPVLEAQACGVPVIVTEFSAQPELCFSGWMVEHSPYWTPQQSFQVHPSIPDILDALERSYRASNEYRGELASKAREGAEAFDAKVVLERYMLPAIQEAEARYAQREPVKLEAAA